MASNNKRILRKRRKGRITEEENLGGRVRFTRLTGEGLWRCLNRENEKESYTNIERVSGSLLRKNKCKGLGAKVSLVCFRNSKKAPDRELQTIR